MPRNTQSNTEMPNKSSTKVKRKRPTKKTAVIITPVQTTAPVENTTAPARPDPLAEVEALKTRLQGAITSVKAQKTRLVEMGRDMVSLVEGLVKDTNQVLRKNLRRKRRTGPNTNSGFMKPKPVSSELCEFLNKPTGTLMSRTDVTRAICEYVKVNDLRRPDNKRVIIPDTRLATLLRMEKDETMTYIHLQSKIGHLFL